jgi:hypothetical protein
VLAALLEDPRSASAVDRSIDSAATKQRRVRGVHDRVNPLLGNVPRTMVILTNVGYGLVLAVERTSRVHRQARPPMLACLRFPDRSTGHAPNGGVAGLLRMVLPASPAEIGSEERLARALRWMLHGLPLVR